jgi:hypothetical protein
MRRHGTVQVALGIEPTLSGHADLRSIELQDSARHNPESCRNERVGAYLKPRVYIIGGRDKG